MADIRKIETVKEILGGLALFLLGVGILAALWSSTMANNEKTREMTRLCLEQDYNGWVDEGGESRCVK